MCHVTFTSGPLTLSSPSDYIGGDALSHKRGKHCQCDLAYPLPILKCVWYQLYGPVFTLPDCLWSVTCLQLALQ